MKTHGLRDAGDCEICLKKLPRRRTDRYTVGHSRCWAVWRKLGCPSDINVVRATIAREVA